MRKLLFFDIDGTIITENHDGNPKVIPDSARQAIAMLQKAGHLCFINTGRAKSELTKDILDFGFDGYVCGCGTYISYKDKELYARTIPFELGNSVIADLESHGLEWLLEGKDNLYYSTAPYHTHIGDFQKDHATQFALSFTKVSPNQAKNLSFDKFCICTDENSNYSGFQDKYKNDFTFIDRGNGFYEVVPVGNSKASGIAFLMDYFQVDLKDTIAIGDSANDLPMLDFAGISIGMGNSSQEVLDRVDYVTDSVLDHGLYNAMKHFNLIA